MPLVSADLSYDVKNQILSVETFKNQFLAGIPIPESITDDFLSFNIDAATNEIENYLSIKIPLQTVSESLHFRRDDLIEWNLMKLSFPCVAPIAVSGMLNQTNQLDYPIQWFTPRTTGDRMYSRMLSMVAYNSSLSFTNNFFQYFPMLVNSRYIPDYWRVTYVTGWQTPPPELVNIIGVTACVKILQIVADALQAGTAKIALDQNGRQTVAASGNFTGLGLGIATKTIQLDGLAQTIGGYANGQYGIWGARIKQFSMMLDASLPHSLINQLHGKYAEMVFAVA